MTTYNILAFSGSLRKDSYNTALVRAFKERAPEGVTIEIAEIGNLPLYDQDAEAEFPTLAMELKAKIEAADAILIATPEHNRSVPSALKNAIDWTSRPWGKNSWATKPVFVCGASIGAIGTALAQYHLKQVLNYLNVRVLGQPEFYLGMAQSKFDAAGKLTDEDTLAHIDSSFAAFTAFIDQLR